MPIWKLTNSVPAKIEETSIEKEKIKEEMLEEWILNTPNLIDEPLFIIGHQIIIPDVKDRLDILALDPQGRAVVVELKRGKIKDPVDIQALRYVSYISKWGYKDFENETRNYREKSGDPDFNFNDLYEEFCSAAGVDEIPNINNDQRMIITGKPCYC